MSTRMLIDARHPEETRVAVVKGNRVEEFDYESSHKRQLKGNIYLAKVTRVEPSLQAAFVEYGGNRQGFLAFSEIHPDYYQIPVADRQALIDEESGALDHDSDHTAKSGGDGGDGGEETEIEQVSGDDDIEEIRRRRSKALRRRYKIQEVIKKRQILLVQVVKEERGSKGAALTTYLSLAGRYCVLMPNSTHSGGISRKIANQADRKRLKSIMTAIDVPPGMGCIIRTAGLSRTKAEIKRDFDYLLRLWNGIRELTMKSVAPTLIYEEANLIKRSIRDLYTRDIDEVLVEGEDGYKAAKKFMQLLMPSHARKVKHYKDRIPLFHRYQVEAELESMYSPTAQLKSGGYIVINPTEALVAIDVNSGRSTKEHNIEETALKTNMEAAEEIARQIRLRDMAGLIVIDFIDMEDRGNNRKVERRMKEVLKTDRARIQVGRLSSFGLMEMSRQRLRPNLIEASMETCPNCRGAGLIRSVESSALHVLRELEEEGIRDRSTEVTVRVPTPVALYLLNNKRTVLAELERRYGYALTVEMNDRLGAEPFEMDRKGAAEAGEKRGDVVRQDTGETEIQDKTADEVITAPTQEQETQPRERAHGGDEEEQPKRRRRRRRRRGRRGRGDGRKPHETQSADTGGDSAGGADQGEKDGKDVTDEAERDDASADQHAIYAQAADSPVKSGASEKAEASGAPGEDKDDREKKSQEKEGARKSRRGRRGGRRRSKQAAAQDGPFKSGATDKEPDSAETADVDNTSDAKVDTSAGKEKASASKSPKRPSQRRAQKSRQAAKDAQTDENAEAAKAETATGGLAKQKDEGRGTTGPTKPKAEQPAQDSSTTAEPAAATATSKNAGNGRDQPGDDGAGTGQKAKETVTEDAKPPSGRKRRGWWQRTFGN